MCEIVERIAKEQRAEGLKEGLAEGIATGAIRGKMTVVRNMLSKGITLEEALELTELDQKTYEVFSKIN